MVLEACLKSPCKISDPETRCFKVSRLKAGRTFQILDVDSIVSLAHKTIMSIF